MTKPLTSLKTPADLVAAGLVAESEREAVAEVAKRYAIALTPAIASRIDRGDPADPLARQFVPQPHELVATEDELSDPIGDAARSPVPGIVHRYRDRVLLKLANVCPVYCRFCFRRESVGRGETAALDGPALDAALAYIRANACIFEVIVTGGDPLILSPRRIGEVTAALSNIAHLRVIRWHTRVPVVAPERVTNELVEALASETKAVYVGLHCNHAGELGGEARAAIARLIEAGIMLVSQTVLLKGVNDDAVTLEALLRALVGLRVKPYYLHHGDQAPGTSHLRTTIEEGLALMRALRGRVSGLALPTYVLDIPGGFGKVPIDADHVGRLDPETGVRIVTDPFGRQHAYRDRSRTTG